MDNILGGKKAVLGASELAYLLVKLTKAGSYARATSL
jgi:hypothetical protein